MGTYRDSLLTRAEAAASVGVTPATWSGYVSRGFAPAPAEVVGRTPLWDPVVVRQWHAGRPGAGRPPKGTPAFSSTLPNWSGPVQRLMLTPEEAAALQHLLDVHLTTAGSLPLRAVRDRLGQARDDEP